MCQAWLSEMNFHLRVIIRPQWGWTGRNWEGLNNYSVSILLSVLEELSHTSTCVETYCTNQGEGVVLFRLCENEQMICFDFHKLGRPTSAHRLNGPQHKCPWAGQWISASSRGMLGHWHWPPRMEGQIHVQKHSSLLVKCWIQSKQMTPFKAEVLS